MINQLKAERLQLKGEILKLKAQKCANELNREILLAESSRAFLQSKEMKGRQC